MTDIAVGDGVVLAHDALCELVAIAPDGRRAPLAQDGYQHFVEEAPVVEEPESLFEEKAEEQEMPAGSSDEFVEAP